MCGIVIARRPLGLAIVDVLPVCRCAESIIPGSVVTGAIGHALGVGVGDLILQTATHGLLEHGLLRVIGHVAIRLGPTGDRRKGVVEGWVLGEERAGRGAWHRRSRWIRNRRMHSRASVVGK